jgi:hypothetical protein
MTKGGTGVTGVPAAFPLGINLTLTRISNLDCYCTIRNCVVQKRRRVKFSCMDLLKKNSIFHFNNITNVVWQKRSRHRAVSTLNQPRAGWSGVRMPAGPSDFSSRSRPDWLWSPHRLLFSQWIKEFYPGSKTAGEWCWLLIFISPYMPSRCGQGQLQRKNFEFHGSAHRNP